jgi:hypothetical protein
MQVVKAFSFTTVFYELLSLRYMYLPIYMSLYSNFIKFWTLKHQFANFL